MLILICNFYYQQHYTISLKTFMNARGLEIFDPMIYTTSLCKSCL